MRQRQRGVALITAILVVTLATLSAVGLLTSANLALHRLGNLQDSERAGWVAKGIESWVRAILEKDRRDNAVDSLDEDWARPVDYLPVDLGSARGAVSDLQGRFNLNLLDPKLSGPQIKLYEAQFKRLLRALDLDGGAVPPGLETLIRDWIDADQEPTAPFGGEDSAYLSLKIPYRTANRPMLSVSELRAVQGITPKLYAALRPYVSALPEKTAINVNTAEAPVLRSLADAVDETKLAAFIKSRKDKPLDNAQQLKTDGVFGDGWEPALATVSSRYFQLRGEVFIGSSRVSLYSAIQRSDQGTTVVLSHSTDE